MSLYRVEDTTSGEVLTLSLEETEALTLIDANEIVWAIEEFGICETDDYAVTEYPEAAGLDRAAA